MTTPYDTGRIKIGSHYVPPVKTWTPSRDQLTLQRALLAHAILPLGDLVDFFHATQKLGAEQSLDGKRLIGFMSPKQLERICDPKDESGVYIPLRETAAGNFTLALYAAMKGEQP